MSSQPLRVGSKPASGDMMDHYRTTYAESHGPGGPAAHLQQQQQARSGGRPFATAGQSAVVSGYALNNRPFSTALDAVKENLPHDATRGTSTDSLQATAHAAAAARYSMPPRRNVFKPISDYLTSKDLPLTADQVANPARAPAPAWAYATNTALSYPDPSRSSLRGYVPTIDDYRAAGGAETGYTLNAAQAVSFPPVLTAEQAEYEARQDSTYKPAYSTTYFAEIATAPLLTAAAEARRGLPPYERTIPSQSGFARIPVDPPCKGTGTNDSKVYAGNQQRAPPALYGSSMGTVGTGGWQHGHFPSGQTRLMSQREVPLSREEKTALAASRFGSTFTGESVHGHSRIEGVAPINSGAAPFSEATPASVYKASFQDPEFQQRPGKESKSLAQTLTANRTSVVVTNNYNNDGFDPVASASATQSQFAVTVEQRSNPFRATRPQPQVLLAPVQTTYDRTFVRHPQPLPM